MSYKYEAFGLVIESEIQMTELISIESGEVDVSIKVGKVSRLSEPLLLDQERKQLNDHQLYLDIDNVAKYLVEDGRRIVVEPYEEALLEGIKLFLLGSCMGAILHQRSILPLHGSCVYKDGQGVLLTGVSGAGKSTITAALCQRGFQMTTDDVAAMTFSEDGKPWAQPSYPSQKLWQDAVERLERKEEKRSLQRFYQDLDKFSVDSQAFFLNEITPLTWIVELIPVESGDLRYEEITGPSKLQVVIWNTYRKFMLKVLGREAWLFKQAATIAGQIRMYRIYRPKHIHLEAEIAELIHQQLLKGGEQR